MAAITRRFRKNAMLYQLGHDGGVHIPAGGPRFWRRLVLAWRKHGRNTPPASTVRFAGKSQERFMSATDRLRRVFFGRGL